MFYCNNCAKEVLIYSLSYSEKADKELDKLRLLAKTEGKILLLNPNPMEPFKCPICGTSIVSK